MAKRTRWFGLYMKQPKYRKIYNTGFNLWVSAGAPKSVAKRMARRGLEESIHTELLRKFGSK